MKARIGWKAAACLAGLLLASGCSRLPALPDSLGAAPAAGAIHVEVALPSPSPDPVRAQGATVGLSVAEFSDARPGSPGRRIGRIQATVRDLHSANLSVDQDVTSLLSGAARGHLAAEGFRVLPAGQAADFALEGVVRAFTMDIAGRDEVTIVVDATLRAGPGGAVAWSGTITEKSDRYAGVMGNSSASIAEYLSEGVGAFAGKLVAAVRKAVASAPTRAGGAPEPARPPVVPPSPARSAVASPAEGAKPAVAQPGGSLWVTTVPPRAKVYLDEVYYGLSPLKIELPAGIVQLRVVAGGFKPVAERVSVRRGQVTEWEVALEK